MLQFENVPHFKENATALMSITYINLFEACEPLEFFIRFVEWISNEFMANIYGAVLNDLKRSSHVRSGGESSKKRSF